MSREFIKKQYNKDQLEKAVRQQQQIQYYTISKVQDHVRKDYIDRLAESDLFKNDALLQWVYLLFKVDNFKSFFKYLRFPISSSRLIKDEVERTMERVFFADDSFCKYIVRGKQIDEPEFMESDDFNQTIYKALFYRPNDIVIHDLKDVNIPYRKLISIDDVVAIKNTGSYIKKIAYKASMEIDEKLVHGNIYMDDEMYAFYPNDENIEAIEVPHDIKRCPATFIASCPFDDREPIIREGVLSRVKPLLEEYVFLTTLRLMTDSNGAFPIIVKLASETIKEELEEDNSTVSPMSYEGHKNNKADTTMQPGSVHDVPVIINQAGNIDMEAVKSYINFFRTPVESLEYVKTRIDETKIEIIKSITGDYVEQSESAMNEMQVSKSYISKQDKLRALSSDMSWCISESDEIMLKLATGDDVEVYRSFGTDFFIETQDDLYNLFAKAPNPVEKTHILYRLSKTRSINSEERMQRDYLMYNLLPFATNTDFEKALGLNLVPVSDVLLQTKFQYFLTIFESNYGDLLEFYHNLGEINSNAKITIVKNLLYQIIKDYETDISGKTPRLQTDTGQNGNIAK